MIVIINIIFIFSRSFLAVNNSMLYTYMISDGHNNIKVGISDKPERRLKQLQTGHPYPLEIIFTEEFNCERNRMLKIEKKLHEEMGVKYKKLHGEWFLIEENQIESVKNLLIWFLTKFLPFLLNSEQLFEQ